MCQQVAAACFSPAHATAAIFQPPVNFGTKFINIVETLYRAPKAQIATKGVLSRPINLKRGTRQGCPLSPLLFALAIKPLAVAIRPNSNISGIRVGKTEHKLSLYADLLIYISNPNRSVPQMCEILNEYSKLSGYKLNFGKSEVMPLGFFTLTGLPDLVTRFKWKPEGFQYLGVHICKDLSNIHKLNFHPLIGKLKTDLLKWKDLPLSSIGRINIIKMNILPKFLYLFQSIPFECPFKLFIEINQVFQSSYGPINM